MRIVWHHDDIVSGIRVRKPGCSEVWLIGYDPSRAGLAPFSVISLDDGMICKKDMSAQDVADFLNEAENQPDVLLSFMERMRQDNQ